MLINILSDRQTEVLNKSVEALILDSRKIDLNLYPNLKIISRIGVGVDNIDLEECRRKGIKVFITPCEELTNAVADFTLHQLEKVYTDSELEKKLALVIGNGRIGRAVGERFRTKQIKVNTIDIKDYEFRSDYELDLRCFVQEAGIVSVHVSGNSEIMYPYLISLMPKNSCLINMAREKCIAFEYAVIRLIDGYGLSSLITDVNTLINGYYEDIIKSDNLKYIETPHIASNAARGKMEELALDNILNQPEDRGVM